LSLHLAEFILDGKRSLLFRFYLCLGDLLFDCGAHSGSLCLGLFMISSGLDGILGRDFGKTGIGTGSTSAAVEHFNSVV